MRGRAQKGGRLPELPIVPLVLAAGDSRRMGFPKALLRLGPATFVDVILDGIGRLPLARPVVIVGKHATLIQPHLVGRDLRVALNPHPEQGQISSLQLALRNAGTFRACLVWPVDQPAIREETVRRLIGLFDDSGAAAAMPRCRGKRGHPALFGTRLCQELLALPVDHSPKELIRSYEKDTAFLETDDPGTVEDIDTPAEFEALLQRLRNRPF